MINVSYTTFSPDIYVGLKDTWGFDKRYLVEVS